MLRTRRRCLYHTTPSIRYEVSVHYITKRDASAAPQAGLDTSARVSPHLVRPCPPSILGLYLPPTSKEEGRLIHGTDALRRETHDQGGERALAPVGAGTPMGETLRRYWRAAGISENLKDKPTLVRVMGEDLVLFRDGAGRPGVLAAH